MSEATTHTCTKCAQTKPRSEFRGDKKRTCGVSAWCGLLCHSCNIMLGNAKDSIEILDRAKRYLAANSQFKLPLKVVNSGE